jgi:hypothetical protein
MFRGNPQQYEKADCETVYLESRWLPSGKASNKISIGAVKCNAGGEFPTVSLQVISFDEKWHCSVESIWLTPDEIDEIARGLIEAKERMLAMRREIENDHGR